MAKKDTPERFPTRDELDYEARREAGFPVNALPVNQSKGTVSGMATPFAVEGNDTSAYVGVSSDYMTYAEETHQPLTSDEGVEASREERFLTQEVLVAPATPEPEGIQTGGGGSSVEPVYTALSGTAYSAEIAKPPEPVKSTESESFTSPLETTDENAEVSEPQGSTGETVADSEAERLELSPDDQQTTAAASPAPATPTPKKTTARHSAASDTSSDAGGGTTGGAGTGTTGDTSNSTTDDTPSDTPKS